MKQKRELYSWAKVALRFWTLRNKVQNESDSNLACHRLGVDLAHVDSGIVPLDTVDHQSPAVVPVVFDSHPREVCIGR